MIAGSLALLEHPASEPLESYSSGGFSTLDVRQTQTYLDDATVQHGRAAATVEGEQEEIHVAGGEIDVESAPVNKKVWTEWVADVTDAGFVVAERTAGSEPPFPFGLIESRTGSLVTPARIDVGQFVAAQRDADRDYEIWMAGRKTEIEDDDAPDDVDIHYGSGALSKDAIQAEIGTGFRVHWHGSWVRGVLYASGYVAIYDPESWRTPQFARFVREEILPVAGAQERSETEQASLEEADA